MYVYCICGDTWTAISEVPAYCDLIVTRYEQFNMQQGIYCPFEGNYINRKLGCLLISNEGTTPNLILFSIPCVLSIED